MDFPTTPTSLDPMPDGRIGFGTATAESDQFSRQLLAAMLAFQEGDFGVRLPSDLTGIHGKIADAFNGIMAVSERRARETSLGTSNRKVRSGLHAPCTRLAKSSMKSLATP